MIKLAEACREQCGSDVAKQLMSAVAGFAQLRRETSQQAQSLKPNLDHTRVRIRGYSSSARGPSNGSGTIFWRPPTTHGSDR